MTKLFWNAFKFSPVVLAATFLAANSAFAGEATESMTSVAELSEETKIGQVTSVSQFTDVQPTDWAFQALQSLVERYGCIAGYPNSTYRGHRALTRYEFAAGLNACLDRINELIAIAVDGVNKEDIEALRRMQEEFAAELATIRGRMDGLEFRVEELEANQFSTTTKLKGEVVIAASGAFGDSQANSGNAVDVEDNVILSNRVRLNFDSSFTGKDRLRVRLQARNTPSFNAGETGTNMTRLGFDGDNGNDFELHKLNYTFKPMKGVKVKIDANAAESNDSVNVFNPVFKSSGGGAISRYARFSPIYRVAGGDAGITVTAGGKKSPVVANVAYFTEDNNDVATGLGAGNSALLGQLEFKLGKKLNIGATYVHAYREDGSGLIGSTGSSEANGFFNPLPTVSNNYGVQASYKLNKKTILSGWYGISDINVENGGQVDGNATVQYWAATLGLKDVGAKGNTLGLIFGQSPRVSDASVFGANVPTGNPDNSYHLEGLYKMKVNDKIAITPGLLVIFDPEHNSNNDDIFVGTIRTTFKF